MKTIVKNICLATLFVTSFYAETNILTLIGPIAVDKNHINVEIHEDSNLISCLLSDSEHNTRIVDYSELLSENSPLFTYPARAVISIRDMEHIGARYTAIVELTHVKLEDDSGNKHLVFAFTPKAEYIPLTIPLNLISHLEDGKRNYIYGGATITIDFETNHNEPVKHVEVDADSGTIQRASMFILNEAMRGEDSFDDEED